MRRRRVALTCAVYHMQETGWIKVSADNVMDLHYMYQDQKKA